jgi:hypothetical protein
MFCKKESVGKADTAALVRQAHALRSAFLGPQKLSVWQ